MNQPLAWWEHRRALVFVTVCLFVGSGASLAQGQEADSHRAAAKSDRSDASDKSDRSDNSPKPAPEQLATEQPPAKGASERKKWIGGSFEAGIRAEWAGDDSDVDLSQTLRLNIAPPEYPRLHINGSLWMLEDLDSDEPRTSPLRDINDAYDSDVRVRLLHLYAELDDVWGKSTLRLGRQRIPEGVAWNLIDGAYFKKTMPRWDWYVFGGVRGSVYRDTHDDAALGEACLSGHGPIPGWRWMSHMAMSAAAMRIATTATLRSWGGAPKF